MTKQLLIMLLKQATTLFLNILQKRDIYGLLETIKKSIILHLVLEHLLNVGKLDFSIL